MTIKVTVEPRSTCKACNGYGLVYNFVPAPFGHGNVAEPVYCDCVEEQLPETDEDIDVTLKPAESVRRINKAPAASRRSF